MEDHHDQGMQRNECNVHRKENKVLLVIFTNTVVDPRAVVIHLSNAPLADTAVVGSVRLDAAAFWTFVDHLTWLQLQALYVLFCSISFWYSPRVCAHSSEMGCQGKKGQTVEDDAVHQAIGEVFGWKQHNKQNHKLSKENEQPRDDPTDDATGISDEPHGVLSIMTGRDTLRGLQAASLPLNVPEPRHRTSHPITRAPCSVSKMLLNICSSTHGIKTRRSQLPVLGSSRFSWLTRGKSCLSGEPEKEAVVKAAFLCVYSSLL